MLPSVVPRLATDSAVSVSWCLETSLFFKTPFPGQSSLPTSFVSLFIFYIFSYLLSKTMGCFSQCLMSFRSCSVEFNQSSNVLLMNLWGRKWSPCPIPPPSSPRAFNCSGFSCCRAWELGLVSFSSCSSWPLENRLNCCDTWA